MAFLGLGAWEDFGGLEDWRLFVACGFPKNSWTGVGGKIFEEWMGEWRDWGEKGLKNPARMRERMPRFL